MYISYNASESSGHIHAKKYFSDNVPLYNTITENHTEFKIAGRKADNFFKFWDSSTKKFHQVAIEYHCSGGSIKIIEHKLEDYSKHNIYTLYILNGLGSSVGERKYPQNGNKISVSNIMRFFYQLYGGRVYYLNIDEEGIQSPIFSLRFPPYIRKKEEKYKLSLRRMLFESNFNLKFSLFENQGYKLIKLLK